MRGRGAAAIAMVLATACTLVSHVDVCERRGPAERDLNARPEGDQTLSPSNAIVALPAGGAFVAWTSTTEAGSVIRGALVNADGLLLPTCAADAEHPYSAREEQAASPALGAPTANDELALLVYRRRAAAGGYEIVGVPLTPGGCPPSISPRPFVIASGPAISNPRPLALGGAEQVVTWTTLEASGRAHLLGRRFRLRLGADPIPRPTVNGPDGEAVDLVTPPAANGVLARLDDGAIALAWLEPETAGFRVRAAVLEQDLRVRAGPVVIDDLSLPSGLIPEEVSIAIAFDGEQLLTSWMAGNDRNEPRVWAAFLTPSLQPLRAERSPEGEPFRLGSIDVAGETEVALARVAGGGFVAAWQESGTTAHEDRSGRGLRALALGQDGRVRFANRACDATDFPLNLAFESDQTLPALATLADETILAAWVTAGGQTADRSGTGLRVVSLRPRDLFAIR
ncbi:MAG: hypothetical protein IT378_16890 [Sandaracinaceae bacterium]|nr:hypothetical protein [Sandaracinaceae bacterium]